MQIIKEGLKAGDLEGVVSKTFSIDQYKSKMGEDASIVVLAFTVDSLAPAKDLERFAETGCPSVLDADATPGTMEDGKHKVFVEFARDEKVLTNIISFLEDVKKLTAIDQFEFISDKVLDVEVCPRFTSINDAIAKWINHLDSNKGKNIDYEQVQMNIDYNEYYLDILLKYFGNMESKVLEDLYNFNNRQYNLNQKKQVYLLFSMVAQLVSFLFLLLLFRRILK